MPKRAAPDPSPKAPRKRGRQAKKKPGDEGEEADADLQYQMRRRQIIDAGDDEELEWVRELEQEEGGRMLGDIYIPPKISRTEHPFTGERLVIEKITCENFKSYGGVKEMGPFHKSFSAIIGPNGNGKSNIIDAMLFVFGYRASKIRCKKVATLIHNSDLLKDVNSCAVTVSFVRIIDDGDKEKESSDGFRVVEGSRTLIKRRAYVNNSSQYYLNNKAENFKEIAKFLKRNGVDLTHNRFLILQGEVEQIAQMPPIGKDGNDGLLEFLEDVIGTRRYIRPLALLEERVEKLDYERDEKIQRVDKAEKEKAALQEPFRKAKEYLRDQNKKIRYQHQLVQRKMYDSKQTITMKEKVKQELDAKVNAMQTRLNEIQAINNERKQEVRAAEKECTSADKEYQKCKKKLDAVDAELIQLVQELQRTNETRKKNKKEKEKLEGELEKLQTLPDSHDRDIKSFTKRKIELDTDIEKEEDAVKGKLDDLNIKVEEKLRMKEKTDKKYQEQKALRDTKKSALDKLQKQLANLKDRETVEKRKLEQLQEDLEKLRETINQKERDGRSSLGNNRVTAMEEKLKQLSSEEAKLVEVENQKRSVFENSRDEFRNAQDASTSNDQMDKVDRALLEAKAEGTLRGLYGRLKNLATIDEKYNIAATISTSMMEHWIVDNDETATNCIAFLRENNLPPQTFVCLVKLQNYQRRLKERFDTPARSHRIFDLLRLTDPILAPAYYKAYQNTLVAENMEIATHVGLGGPQRHRVVTLKGEIVEKTGSMVGGGRSPTAGKYNSKKSGLTMTRQQLATLKKRHEEALQAYQEAQEARQVVTDSLRKIGEEIADIKRKINNFASDITALKSQLPLKESNLENQKKKLKECTLTPSVLKGKEEEIESAQKDFDDLEDDFREAEEDFNRINQLVEELQVTKKKAITAKLDKFKEQRKKVEEELNRKIVELKNYEANKKKSEKKLETIIQQISEMESTMEKTNEKRKAKDVEVKELKQSETELSVKLEEAKTKLQEVKSKSHQFEKEENALIKQKVANDNELQDAENELKFHQKHLKQQDDELHSLKLYDIPEDDIPPLEIFPEAEVKRFIVQALQAKLKKYEDKIQSTARPNLNILDEYRHKLESLHQRIQELEEITKERDEFREEYCKLEEQRSTEFMEGFALISSRLKEMFRMISMGGDAELEVVDTLDLFGCGIHFSVRPARKTWKKISNLSGGEKTLASLSLVFALHHFKPSPFYVMDEIDAALDFKNVSIIANYIKDRTKFTQFIIISLRSNMFELADSLLGVYKVDNMSYCIHFGVKKMVEDLKRMVATPQSQGAQSQKQSTQSSQPPAPKEPPQPPDSQPRDSQPEPPLTQPVDNPPETVEKEPEMSEDSDEEPEQIPETPPNNDTVIANESRDERDDSQEELVSVVERRLSHPMYTSTPFVGRKPAPVVERNQGGGGQAEEPVPCGSQQMDLDLSPIKGTKSDGAKKANVSSADDSFQSAEEG